MIEAYGTGILKINESYDDYSVKPLIETTDNAFKVTLPNINFYTKEYKKNDTSKTMKNISVNKKQERINSVLKLCRSKDGIVRKDVEKHWAYLRLQQFCCYESWLMMDYLLERGKLKIYDIMRKNKWHYKVYL